LIELDNENIHSEPESIDQPNVSSYSANLNLNSESKSLLAPNLIHNLPHLDGTINNMSGLKALKIIKISA